MILFNKKNVFRVALVVWVALWANFICRDLFRKGEICEYRALAGMNEEARRAYTYGGRFYGFLRFAKDALPQKSAYEFAGVERFSLEARRGIYYLYPHLEKEDAEFILVYGKPGYSRPEFGKFAELDNGRFVLKKK